MSGETKVSHIGVCVDCEVADDSELVKEGDAVILTGNYKVALSGRNFRPVFGQVVSLGNGRGISVQACGLCIFTYEGPAPRVNGRDGVQTSPTVGGLVAGASDGSGRGINLAVDEENKTVHVLL